MKPNDNYITSLSDSIFRDISAVSDTLGFETYIIGGYVRDIFLNRPSKDIDIVTVGSGISLAEALADKWKKKHVHLSVFKNFGTAQLKWLDVEIELVGARKESYQRNSRKPIVEDGTLEDDQNRRDFTINALALCLNGNRFGELLDPFNGLQDIQNRIIRTPLDPDITFSDDPLRMMRAVRFATQLNFTILPETFKALFRNRERIGIISQERITDELTKIVAAPKPSTGFQLLDKCGLLDIIFPELTALKGIEIRRGRGHKDNFLHTLEVLDNVAEISDNIWLRWAAIFHDIAKPVTKRWDDALGWTFHNHNYIGEKMTFQLFKRMKFPLNEKLRYVQKLVSLHMRPIVLAEEEITDSAIRRLLFDAGNDIDDLMMLCEADITSKNREKVKRYLENFQLVRRKLKEIEEKDRIRNFQPPIDGEEIMKLFNLQPSREVGIIKTAIKDALLDGIIPNEYEAAYQFMMDFVANMGLKDK
ncbi:MAG: CCA tRNA nucleotidyltransferase [Bacteroidales bacterium]|nr:CCA tRNA nucleotidyltransferase [Bacteroidales bacterium]